MRQETSVLQQLIVDTQLKPCVSVAAHLVGHDVVTDSAERSFEDQLLLALGHFWQPLYGQVIFHIEMVFIELRLQVRGETHMVLIIRLPSHSASVGGPPA